MQSEISALVLQKIGELAELVDGDVSVTKGTKNPLAYEIYLKGTHLASSGNPDDLLKAIEFFHQTVQLDDQFVEAWEALAFSYIRGTLLPWALFPPSQACPIAMHAARTVLALDPDNALARTSLGWCIGIYDYDWVEAKRQMQLTIELNPKNPLALAGYGQFLTTIGHAKEGAPYIAQAYKLNPYEYLIAMGRAEQLFEEGKLLEAFGVISNMRFYGKDRYDTNMAFVGMALAQGRTEAAREYLEKARAMVEGQYVALEIHELNILLQEGRLESLELKRQELFELGQSEFVPGIGYLSSNEDELIESHKIMFQNRDPELFPSLNKTGGKPYSMSESDWNVLLVSRPREFHPQPLAEPYVTLSCHTAPIIETQEYKKHPRQQTDEDWRHVPSPAIADKQQYDHESV